MPAWLEILINLIGYGGFIAIAMYHRSPNEKPPWRDPRSPAQLVQKVAKVALQF